MIVITNDSACQTAEQSAGCGIVGPPITIVSIIIIRIVISRRLPVEVIARRGRSLGRIVICLVSDGAENQAGCRADGNATAGLVVVIVANDAAREAAEQRAAGCIWTKNLRVTRRRREQSEGETNGHFHG